MKTIDFSPKITSAYLLENMRKQFGTRVDLAKYDREQLEDIRNKLRTRIFQQEGSSGVNDLLTNEAYQKDKAMLELLNIRIKEMLGEDIKKLRDKMDQLSESKKEQTDKKALPSMKASGAISKDKKVKEASTGNAFTAHKEPKPATGTGKFDKQTVSTGDVYTRKTSQLAGGTEEPRRAATTMKSTTTGRPLGEDDAHPKDCECKECMGTMEGKKGVNPFAKKKPDDDKDGVPNWADKKPGKDDTEGKKKGAAPKKGVNPFAKKKVKESFNVFKHNVRFVNESIGYLLQEDEEGKAKTITAAGDMVNDFTSWMQRVGQYQTKAIIELSDEIRAEFGPAEAEAFKQAVGPALSATLETLTQNRESISNAVAQLASGTAPPEGMGMEPDMDAGMDAGMDTAPPDAMNPEMGGDEFGASDAAVGGPEASGRELRESKFARRLAESHSIMSKLAS